ncbi:thymidine kinase [Clostridium sp. Marseille-P2415]|uniref:thymidine kinase n=1 Tax=Clostridium sp. Marseille-P2415 TaxID=1805471 RepID=UPI0009887635|nr:thymidine kinase [Clostridium sp. Marseille-P2415]
MAKLYFKYGAMGSSKTANALMTRYNFMEKEKSVLLVKPDIETRDEKKKIRSRIGLEAECILWSEFQGYDHKSIQEFDVIIVDEVQFLSETDIDRLADIVDQYRIPVLCYGLRTDFTSHLFPGSKRLLELADEIEELKTVCWCGNNAGMNARIDKNGNVLRDGEQILMGANDKYVSLCRKHYKEGKIKPDA